jgi:hypothetical protein
VVAENGQLALAGSANWQLSATLATTSRVGENGQLAIVVSANWH